MVASNATPCSSAELDLPAWHTGCRVFMGGNKYLSLEAALNLPRALNNKESRKNTVKSRSGYSDCRRSRVSMLIATTSKARPPSLPCNASSAGISMLHANAVGRSLRSKPERGRWRFIDRARVTRHFASAAVTSFTASSLAHSAGPAMVAISQPDGSTSSVVGMPSARPTTLSSWNTLALGSA